MLLVSNTSNSSEVLLTSSEELHVWVLACEHIIATLLNITKSWLGLPQLCQNETMEGEHDIPGTVVTTCCLVKAFNVLYNCHERKLPVFLFPLHIEHN